MHIFKVAGSIAQVGIVAMTWSRKYSRDIRETFSHPFSVLKWHVGHISNKQGIPTRSTTFPEYARSEKGTPIVGTKYTYKKYRKTVYCIYESNEAREKSAVDACTSAAYMYIAVDSTPARELHNAATRRQQSLQWQWQRGGAREPRSLVFVVAGCEKKKRKIIRTNRRVTTRLHKPRYSSYLHRMASVRLFVRERVSHFSFYRPMLTFDRKRMPLYPHRASVALHPASPPLSSHPVPSFQVSKLPQFLEFFFVFSRCSCFSFTSALIKSKQDMIFTKVQCVPTAWIMFSVWTGICLGRSRVVKTRYHTFRICIHHSFAMNFTRVPPSFRYYWILNLWL